MASPRVLLLGGHGKVALHLTPLLLDRGWDVVSVVRNTEHEAEILRLNDHEGTHSGGDRGGRGTVSVLVSSLDDVKSVDDAERVIEQARPDYVVWAAGIIPLFHPWLAMNKWQRERSSDMRL
jgi:nucleoside-diphosphate-sugar epimerase